MLDFTSIQQQFQEFGRYQAAEHRLLEDRLALALETLQELDETWQDLVRQIEPDVPAFRVGRPMSSPARGQGASVDRPAETTVVATDGSQIYPDRHLDPPCYLVNVSQIALQYGTLEEPVMRATPQLRFRQKDIETVLADTTESITANIVSALRDQEELDALLSIACSARRPGRFLLALGDGTLIRWMLSGLNKPKLEELLIQRYTETLSGFREQDVPVASYVSRPASRDLVNLLRFALGEQSNRSASRLSGLTDALVYAHVLKPGDRSAVFESPIGVLDQYAPEDQICYTYIRVPGWVGDEVARIEMPRWVAEDDILLDLLHAVVLDQAEKGRGYPSILSEAHEHAIIRRPESELFYVLLDECLVNHGLQPVSSSYKRLSKMRPLV
ncbi:MAG: DNA double-strand break repair nuclease NurA [Bacteroidota bacterium]